MRYETILPIKFTSPTRVALIFATEPVFVAIGDFAWNGILLGPITLVGCHLILLGMILAEIPIAKSFLPYLKKNKKLYKKIQVGNTYTPGFVT